MLKAGAYMIEGVIGFVLEVIGDVFSQWIAKAVAKRRKRKRK